MLLVCSLALPMAMLPGGGFALNAHAAEQTDSKQEMLLPGGTSFGVQLQTEGVLVVGTAPVDCPGEDISPAEQAGIHAGDILSSIDGKAVNTVSGVVEQVEKSDGQPLKLTVTRQGKSLEVNLCPVRSESENTWKAGVWIRDSTAGIGTVTFYCPRSNSFSGLGHGICDSDTGVLMPLLRGSVMEVTISGIQKGHKGAPGELRGYFSSAKIGSLIGNTVCGVFGVLNKLPDYSETDLLPVATDGEIEEGDASIRCTVDGEGIKEYTVKIIKLCGNDPGGKNFVIELTDPDLLAKTGGIVQGMSGSPVIQKGKLVGAVTHVLLDEPTKGYGILIGNILKKMPEIIG